jgi:hypothetical protein
MWTESFRFPCLKKGNLFLNNIIVSVILYGRLFLSSVEERVLKTFESRM